MKKNFLAIVMVLMASISMAQQKTESKPASPKFLLLFRFKADAPPPTPDQLKASQEKWGQWMGGLAQHGKLDGGEQIAFGGTTITGTKKEVQNKPVVAHNELITGYMVILAKDFKEAETIAKECPIFSFNGSVEIRQVQPQQN